MFWPHTLRPYPWHPTFLWEDRDYAFPLSYTSIPMPAHVCSWKWKIIDVIMPKTFFHFFFCLFDRASSDIHEFITRTITVLHQGRKVIWVTFCNISGQCRWLLCDKQWLGVQSNRSLTRSCYARQQCPAKCVLCSCKIIRNIYRAVT